MSPCRYSTSIAARSPRRSSGGWSARCGAARHRRGPRAGGLRLAGGDGFADRPSDAPGGTRTWMGARSGRRRRRCAGSKLGLKPADVNRHAPRPGSNSTTMRRRRRLRRTATLRITAADRIRRRQDVRRTGSRSGTRPAQLPPRPTLNTYWGPGELEVLGISDTCQAPVSGTASARPDARPHPRSRDGDRSTTGRDGPAASDAGEACYRRGTARRQRTGLDAESDARAACG